MSAVWLGPAVTFLLATFVLARTTRRVRREARALSDAADVLREGVVPLTAVLHEVPGRLVRPSASASRRPDRP